MRDLIKLAVDRFLGWRLPVDFFPDHYITFDAERARNAHGWPTGTNLFHAGQAQAMFEHCLNGAVESIKDQTLPQALPDDALRYAMDAVKMNNPEGARHIKAVWLAIRDALLHPVGDNGDTEPLAGQTWQAPLQDIVDRKTTEVKGLMNVVEGKFGKQACGDLSAQLRAMADAVDRGEIVDFVAAYTERGEYETFYASALDQSLVLASLLHRRCVDRFFVGD